jgi:hypothetical protein
MSEYDSYADDFVRNPDEYIGAEPARGQGPLCINEGAVNSPTPSLILADQFMAVAVL